MASSVSITGDRTRRDGDFPAIHLPWQARVSRFTLFGPVLFYDMVRTGRRRRYLAVRGVYALFLTAILFFVYGCWFLGESEPLKAMLTGSLPAVELANFAASFFYVFVVVQFVVVFVLTPAYAAGVLAEEKERHTLEAILATDLSSREIVLGLFVSRLANLTLLVATGLPILSFLQFLGGVEPSLLLASFAFTGLTMISLAGLSVLNSVLAKRPREAIIRTYVMATAYLAISGLSWLALLPALGLAAFPSTDNWPSPITLEEVIGWSSAGNVVAVVTQLVIGVSSGRSLNALLPVMLRDYAAFHGLIAVGSCFWAIVRLRAATLETEPEPQRTEARRQKQARSSIYTWLSARPMLWKELHTGTHASWSWLAWLRFGVMIAVAFWPAIVIVSFFDRFTPRPPEDRFEDLINFWVRGLGTFIACFMLLHVALRAAGSVSGEREQQTMDSLLATPLRNRSILYAKWLGSICGPRKPWLFLSGIWVVGLFTGGLHPLAIPCVVIAWLAYAAFVAALGLWFSVASRTTRHATVLTPLALGAVLSAAFLATVDLAGVGPFDEGLAQCLFAPFALSTLAFSPNNFHEFLSRDAVRVSFRALIVMVEIALWPLLACVLLHLAKVRFRFLTGRPDDGTSDAKTSAEPSHSVGPGTCPSSAPTPGLRTWELIVASLAPMCWLKRFTQTALLLLPILLVVAGYVYLRFNAEVRLRGAMAEANRLDAGWRLEELEAKREIIPDDQNGAQTILRASKLIPQSTGSSSQLHDPKFLDTPPNCQFDLRQIQGLKDELARIAAGVTEARRLKDFPKGRFSLDSSAHQATQVSKILVWDAVLRAQEMNVDGAIEDCLAILNMCQAIGDEPSMTAQLGRNSIWTTIADTTERVLAQGEPSEALMAVLQRALTHEIDHPMMLCAMRGERAAIDSTLEKVQAGNVKNVGYIAINRGSLPHDEEAALLLSGPIKRQRAEILRINTALVEAAKLPLDQQALEFGNVLGQLSINPASPQRLLIPTFQLSWWRPQILLNQARLSAATVAVAVERFRRTNNRWPESLGELSPALLERVPDDPFDGNPLRYRKVDDGVVIYTVGPDGVDNGGNLGKGKRFRSAPVGTDIGVRLWNPDQRRQPEVNAAPK